MKRNIAIVAGGDTSEIVVSLRSAQGIYSFIDKEKYKVGVGKCNCRTEVKHRWTETTLVL